MVRVKSRSKFAFKEWMSPEEAETLLAMLCGWWVDTKGSSYAVSEGVKSDAVNVVTERPNGATRSTSGLIRIEWRSGIGRIVWGRGGPGYQYKLLNYNVDTLEWAGSNSSNFQWYREDDEDGVMQNEEEEDEESEEDDEESWTPEGAIPTNFLRANDAEALLLKLCGEWLDNKQSQYRVTENEERFYLDVSTKRPNGAVRTTPRLIHIEWQGTRGRVAWGFSKRQYIISFYDGEQLEWDSGSSKFQWRRFEPERVEPISQSVGRHRENHQREKRKELESETSAKDAPSENIEKINESVDEPLPVIAHVPQAEHRQPRDVAPPPPPKGSEAASGANYRVLDVAPPPPPKEPSPSQRQEMTRKSPGGLQADVPKTPSCVPSTVAKPQSPSCVPPTVAKPQPVDPTTKSEESTTTPGSAQEKKSDVAEQSCVADDTKSEPLISEVAVVASGVQTPESCPETSTYQANAGEKSPAQQELEATDRVLEALIVEPHSKQSKRHGKRQNMHTYQPPLPWPPWNMPPAPDLACSAMYYPWCSPQFHHSNTPTENSLSQDEVKQVAEQIEYWFSDKNLVSDRYLRSSMLDEGWVHLAVLQNFRRMQLVGADTWTLRLALIPSETLELDGTAFYVRIRDKERRKRWLPKPGTLPVSACQ